MNPFEVKKRLFWFLARKRFPRNFWRFVDKHVRIQRGRITKIINDLTDDKSSTEAHCLRNEFSKLPLSNALTPATSFEMCFHSSADCEMCFCLPRNLECALLLTSHRYIFSPRAARSFGKIRRRASDLIVARGNNVILNADTRVTCRRSFIHVRTPDRMKKSRCYSL